MSARPPIDSFSGHYSWLSNFYRCSFAIGGVVYASTEHYYQAAKAPFGSPEYIAIRDAKNPAEAKRLGQLVILNSPDWEREKIGVMRRALSAKFRQNANLTKWLLQTADAELIEGNTWNDTFWGVCKGKGRNELGKLLMELRAEIADELKRRLTRS
jgi:ribA/ribD-fused uncharacterized protein